MTAELLTDEVANGEVVNGEVEIDVGAVSAEDTEDVVYGEVDNGVLVIEEVTGIDGAEVLGTKLNSLGLLPDCIDMTLKSFQSGRFWSEKSKMELMLTSGSTATGSCDASLLSSSATQISCMRRQLDSITHQSSSLMQPCVLVLDLVRDQR